MSAVRASFRHMSWRTTPRCPAQPQLRIVNTRRGYASQRPGGPSSPVGGSGSLPLLLGAIAVILPGTFYLLGNISPNVAHNDHEAQKSLRTSNTKVEDGKVQGIEVNAEASNSDLPADAPNRPDNREQIEKTMQQKPPTKRVDPMKQ